MFGQAGCSIDVCTILFLRMGLSERVNRILIVYWTNVEPDTLREPIANV